MGLGLEKLDESGADAVAGPGGGRARGDSGQGVGVLSRSGRGGPGGSGERGRDALVGEDGVDEARGGREGLPDPLGGRGESEDRGQRAGDGGVGRRESCSGPFDERRASFGFGLERREELLERRERLLGLGGDDVAFPGDRLDEARGGGEGLGGEQRPGLLDGGSAGRQGGDDGLEADGGGGRGACRDEDGELGEGCVFEGRREEVEVEVEREERREERKAAD